MNRRALLQRVSRTVAAMVLILLLFFLPLLSQAQGPMPTEVSAEALPEEVTPGVPLRDSETTIPGLESRLALLYNAERTGDAEQLATLAGERHIDLQNRTARVILEMESDPGAQPAGEMTVETVARENGGTAQIRHAPPVAIRPGLEKAIAATGATYETAYENWVQVLAPIASLEQLTRVPDVGFVRLPYPSHTLQGPQPLTATVSIAEQDRPLGNDPQAGASVTQGVNLTNASSWHALGYDGTGVNLAVFDFGFTGWQSRWTADDLSRAIVLNDWSSSYSFSPDTPGFTHGTACAEIAYDMAPDSEIHLYAFDTEVEFAGAVNDYRYNVYGKKVVSMSIGWVNAGPYDGTGEIADIVNNARWSGIFWANAAGNEQGSHYSSTYREYKKTGSHQWALSSDNYMLLGPKDTPGASWCFMAGTEISLYLEWNDWDAGRRRNVDRQDYDLYLFQDNGTGWVIIASSTNDQCLAADPPVEAISYIVPTDNSCDYAVYINAYENGCSNSKNAFLDLYSFTSAGARTLFTYNTECNSLSIPADADGAAAVGATFWGDDGNGGYTYGLEPFSSLGPRNAAGGANPGTAVGKPDVVAPDGVDTVSYGPSDGFRYVDGGDGFWGTSAAAPHVAGLAATVWEAYPNYTLAQLRSYIQTQALYKANGGTCGGGLCGEGEPESGTQNNRFGWGRINLGAAPPLGPIIGEPAPLCMDDPMSLELWSAHPTTGNLAASPSAGMPAPAVFTMTTRDLAVQMPLAAATEQEVLDLQPLVPGQERAISAEDIPLLANPDAVAAIANVEVGKGHAYFRNDESYASVDTDADGNIYVAFEVNNGDYDLGIAMSADNGRTWDIGILDGPGHPNERYPSLAVDDSGFIWVGYSRNSGSGYHPSYAVSVYPQDIRSWLTTSWTALTGGAMHPAIDAVGSDTAALVFLAYEYPYGAYTNVIYNYTLDGGSTWNASWRVLTRNYNGSYPTVALSNIGVTDYVNIAFQENTYGSNSQVYRAYTINGLDWYFALTTGNVGFPDMAASGPNVYLAYQFQASNNNDDVEFLYSTDGGQSFSVPYPVADSGGRERYPVVSASGSQPRVAYYYDTTAVYLELPSANYGAAWANTPYQMDDATNAPVAPAPRNLDVAYRVAQHPAVAWSADPVPTGSDNLYYSTINEAPTVPTLAWPAAGATLQALAPSLSWNASSNADGDAIGYWWYMDTGNPPGTLVGGPVARTASLPSYTAPGVTYYWQVVADDGYQTASSAVRSFSTANETFSGSPLAYTEDFTTDPVTRWTRHGFACVDCFESDSSRWTVSPAGTWGRSNEYAWDGHYSAKVLYDANLADYLLTSSALDLRGATWAYFNSHLRGSSEPDRDYLMLESRASGSSPWVLEDARSGHYNAGWWKYYEGNVDLSAYAGSNTSQVRFHFSTDALNYGYGFGWYEDRPEVSRESEWAWRNVSPLYYRLQTQGAWIGYTNYLVDHLYSPYILLPNTAGSSIRLTLSERYVVSAGDRATIWIFDTATGAWQQLTYYNGTQPSWTDRNIDIPDSYKGKRVVFGLVLQSDGSGVQGQPEEQAGYWDIDRFHLEEYSPTAVKLASFTAQPAGSGVLLAWETVSELDNVGFNLYRSTSGEEIGRLLNPELIPSPTPGGGQGARYEFLDETAVAGVRYYYTLEDVDVNGARTRHGPVALMLWRACLPMVGR